MGPVSLWRWQLEGSGHGHPPPKGVAPLCAWPQPNMASSTLSTKEGHCVGEVLRLDVYVRQTGQGGPQVCWTGQAWGRGVAGGWETQNYRLSVGFFPQERD